MKAVIYDKWLHSLGGGEVVACSIAKILIGLKYEVLFISGKDVSKETIYDKLKIDLKGVELIQLWNDELALKKLTSDADLFINISFMDYSRGFARKNIYFVNFPTTVYDTVSSMLFFRVFVPIYTTFVKPLELVGQIEAQKIMQNEPAYELSENNKYAISSLQPKKPEYLEFRLYLESFNKGLIDDLLINVENGEVLDRKIRIDHNKNIVSFMYKILPKSSTIYLKIQVQNFKKRHQDEKIYLLYPKIRLKKISKFLFKDFFDRVNIRLRAGIFVNTLERLETYQLILTYSQFAKKWIRKYWKREAVVLAPPVEMLFKTYKIKFDKKQNWICSVGRFFTLGHGKKQEILVDAFKKLVDQTKNNNWQLHLVGGLGDEPTSIEFFKYLKQKSAGYPIFFHVNASRKEVEDIYLKSKIYWHATGFGEDEDNYPIKFEHFGISPIEAMSAGCIPVLFNGGGLGELIEASGLDRNRNLFGTIKQLVENTSFFQETKNQNLDWKNIFESIDEHFSDDSFKERFIKILQSLK